MNVAFVSAEVAPYSKAGGLADVAGSLPQALVPYVTAMQVITPLYGQIDRPKFGIIPTGIEGSITFDQLAIPYTIHHQSDASSRVETWFVECDQYFGRPGIYTAADGQGFADNNLRYFFFQLVVLDLLKKNHLKVNILHCNDHHTGLLPGLLKTVGLQIKSIFTIHNFLYHGHFSAAESTLLPKPLLSQLSKTQWGNYSALLEGIDHADAVNTVSPGYAHDLLRGDNLDEPSHKHILAAQSKFTGIVNGIDTKYWNPEIDPYTPFTFSINDLSGKLKNKQELQQRNGLDVLADMPLFGSISRLVENKGFPLIIDLLDDYVEQGAQFIFLGSGDQDIANQLREASLRHPGKIAFKDGFNEPLAHLIEAGSDLFLMPSRFEPCGLNQLYSLRYGTIPIVHQTGGLGDTVQNWEMGQGTGFVFEPYESGMLRAAMDRALDTFKLKGEWSGLIHRAMSKDFSWDQSARQYFRIYKS